MSTGAPPPPITADKQRELVAAALDHYNVYKDYKGAMKLLTEAESGSGTVAGG